MPRKVDSTLAIDVVKMGPIAPFFTNPKLTAAEDNGSEQSRHAKWRRSIGRPKGNVTAFSKSTF
jgi:hypothetical protein